MVLGVSANLTCQPTSLFSYPHWLVLLHSRDGMLAQSTSREDYILLEKRFSFSMDEQIAAPIGFNITFPGMISLAIGMGLEFPVRQTDVDEILSIWQMELKRFAGNKSDGREAYLAYVAEGLGNLLD